MRGVDQNTQCRQGTKNAAGGMIHFYTLWPHFYLLDKSFFPQGSRSDMLEWKCYIFLMRKWAFIVLVHVNSCLYMSLDIYLCVCHAFCVCAPTCLCVCEHICQQWTEPGGSYVVVVAACGSGGSQWLGELDFLERVLQATRARVTNTHVG